MVMNEKADYTFAFAACLFTAGWLPCGAYTASRAYQPNRDSRDRSAGYATPCW